MNEAITSEAVTDAVVTDTAVTDTAVTDTAVTNRANGFRFPLDVRFFEVDSLGVVFNMWYLGWCDEAMSAFMESIGYGYATLRAGGLDAVLRKAELEWLDSIEAFQQVEIAVQVDHVGTTSFRLRYDVDRVDISGQRRVRCARVAITYVCVEIMGRGTAPIPAGLRDALVAEGS